MKPPSFQWYPKDCDTDETVRTMSDEEFGFYMRCLNHAWLNNGLPEDFEKLAKLFPRDRRILRRLWETVRPLFVLEDGRYLHPKLETQRQTVRYYVDSKRRAARARWDKEKPCNADAYADAKQVECLASASASASPEETHTCAADAAPQLAAIAEGKSWYDREHERWYKGFWNHTAKKASRVAFEKRVRLLVTTGKTPSEAVVFLCEQVSSDRGRFEPTEAWAWRQNMHPATWLNGARWEDEARGQAKGRDSPTRTMYTEYIPQRKQVEGDTRS